MPKQRKTREEKISSNTKRQESTVSYSLSSLGKTPQTKHVASGDSYGYVTKDIKKTFIVSASLILLQLFLFFLLQHRVVVIPGVTY